MLINLTLTDRLDVWNTVVNRQVEIDEASMPDYPRPLKGLDQSQTLFTETAKRAFAAQIIRGLKCLIP